MVWVGCRSRCTESQWIRGRRSGHCCSNSQGVGQEPCTQSFGEILGEGQRRLQREEGAQRDVRRWGGKRGKIISSRGSEHGEETDAMIRMFQMLLFRWIFSGAHHQKLNNWQAFVGIKLTLCKHAEHRHHVLSHPCYHYLSLDLRFADGVGGMQTWHVKGYRQIGSPVLLVSAEERVRLARHAVPVPSTWYVLTGNNTVAQLEFCTV